MFIGKSVINNLFSRFFYWLHDVCIETEIDGNVDAHYDLSYEVHIRFKPLLIRVHMEFGHQTPVRNLHSPPNLHNLENDDIHKNWGSLHFYFYPKWLKFCTQGPNLFLI